MGRIYALSGPSGVGKTTFQQALVHSAEVAGLRLLPRYTDRPQRHGEEDGFEYFFISHNGLLQKVFANDFIHIEKWGDYYSAIESRVIEETLDSDEDGLVLASTFGAARLRATYGRHLTLLYMWTSGRDSLLNPRCMEITSSEVGELTWRMKKKLREEGYSEFETASLDDADFVSKRMVDNFLDIAAVNGRLRAGEDIVVVPNLRDRLGDAVGIFEEVRRRLNFMAPSTFGRRGTGCFVLMPFREDLAPVYEDHIVAVCERLSISVSRADQIFSARPFMDDILEAVTTARYVIADLTDNNPNVLYEVGICHALGKEVVLLTQASDEVPADLRHLRHIRYNYTPRGMQALERALEATLVSLQAL